MPPALFGLTPSQIAQELSPVQFEQLVQAYLAGQMRSAGLGKKDGHLPSISLYATHNSSQWTSWDWELGWASSGPKTKGEIFAMCDQEHGRRLGFDQQCKLLQIEHQHDDNLTPIGPEIGDEIPF